MKKKKKPLHLYVWEGVLTDYTSGVIFALAESEEKAREQVRKKYVSNGDSGSRIERDMAATPLKLTRPDAFAVWGGG